MTARLSVPGLMSPQPALFDSRKDSYARHGRSLKFRGEGGLKSQKFILESIKLNWKFQEGGGGRVQMGKNLPWGRYGYFLEPHICNFS